MPKGVATDKMLQLLFVVSLWRTDIFILVNFTTKQMDDIHIILMTLAQEETYQDVMLVCKDEIILGVRVFALAYPLMAEVLKERSEQKELVVFLPDFKSQEEFLTSGIKKEKDREWLMEDVNFRDIFEPVVENGTHRTQEAHKADSNFTYLYAQNI